jgi:hypothetical protein
MSFCYLPFVCENCVTHLHYDPELEPLTLSLFTHLT